MTPYVFEALVEDERKNMYYQAIHQLEAQLFEAQINLEVVPDPNQPNSQTGESVNQSIQRLTETIERLKAAETSLLG